MAKLSRSVFSLAAAALLLGACASLPAQDDYSWSHTPAENGVDAKLYYGEPESDVVWLGFTCAPRGRAELLVFVDEDPAAWPKTLALRSGGAALPIKAEPDPSAEIAILRAPIDPAAPAIAAFARTGRLQWVWNGDASPVGAEAPDERRQIAAFWRGCAGRP